MNRGEPWQVGEVVFFLYVLSNRIMHTESFALIGQAQYSWKLIHCNKVPILVKNLKLLEDIFHPLLHDIFLMTLSLFLGLGRPPSREEDTFRFFFVRVREGEREGETTTVDETRAKERAEREIRAL